MDFQEESADPFDEILRSIKASSQDSSPEEEAPSHDFHDNVDQTTDEHKASPVEFYPSIADTFPSEVFGEGHTSVFPPDLTSPFQAMSGPTLAMEPPTSHGNAFHFLDFSTANFEISRPESSFESHLKTSLDFQNERAMFPSSSAEILSASPNSSPEAFTAFPFSSHIYGDHLPFLYPEELSFHSSPTQIPSSSPDSSPGAFAAFPMSSHNLYGDHMPFTYPKDFGVPIARSHIRGHSDGMPGGRRGSRHHRDLSGTSSTTSTISGPPYDFCSAIDPSALQPPLIKLQTELGFANSETSQIISPFINQVIEQGPDGTITGRYSRPLTSTGRPSHARKTPPGHVKRPRNAFILFRSYACSSNLIPPAVEKDHRQISRIVSHMWKSLPADERLKWERKAEEEKDLHRKLHPDYRYKPIYRKDNAAKKNQGRLATSSAARKKGVSRKNAKGLDASDCGDFSAESTNFGAFHGKSHADLLRERDEEIRCEAVAKVLMEARLSGITLEDGEMEERVQEEVRLVKLNEPHQFQTQPQSEIGEGDQITSSFDQNSESTFPSFDDYRILFPNPIPENHP
ncbi:hypothetical protein PGT21_016398 [Puccinia graminis f. sp. tritici]|uniref:HMG box domain-containing protein n=2 Tax=Puccinia graminis f. sp. tritici TaxID=56615 RepID=E3KAW4_PUCGT|nr:uncharacterized protein PGTG_06975 [Puccinia graminis f. sp. tritici CRL 75-36-700-3]EFP81354.2 hypothetical protein PGTG_06975 [Puccinia graminis f. sp. tritici CRL 75-36-700-3]KAA1119151.1 hypothetical protein PGT21_016398 [Puccinia graminis f. sp. tritici]